MELSELRTIRMARLDLNRKLLSLREIEGAEDERRAAVDELGTLADREDVLVASLGIDECSVAYQVLMQPSLGSEIDFSRLMVQNGRLTTRDLTLEV